MDKEMRKLVERLVADGYEVTLTRKGRHIVKRDGSFVAVLAGKVGDPSGYRNALAAIRRAERQR